jgi:hypothetical protein
MADTFTKRLNLTKPEVGGSRDAWGGKINDSLDALDAAIMLFGNDAATGDFLKAKWAFGLNPATGNLALRYTPPPTDTVPNPASVVVGTFTPAGAFTPTVPPLGDSATRLTAASLGGGVGYRRWSDGAIEQWGFITIPGDTYVTFPIVFPNACRTITLTPSGFNPDLAGCQVDEVAPSRFRAYARVAANGGGVSAATFPAYYYARGF